MSSRLAFAASLLALLSAPGFAAESCTGECQEGYEFAKKLDLDEPSQCGGKSEAFINGCRIYAGEQAADSITDGEASTDPDEDEPGFEDEDAWKKF